MPELPSTEKMGFVGRLLLYKGVHCLRHSYALYLSRRGLPLKTIGDLLGHRTPESTGVYIRLTTEGLRKVALNVPVLSQLEEEVRS